MSKQPQESKDAVAAASERICAHMNGDHAPSCLAYAWHLLNRKDAIAAKMTSISSEGFTLSITPRDKPSTSMSRTYCFRTPVKSAAEAKDRLIALHNQCCKGFVPLELAVVITVAAYVLIFVRRIAATASAVPLVGSLAFTIFPSSAAAGYTLAVVQFLHFLEVLFCIYMCTNLKFSVGLAATWLPLVQVFGLPVARRLRQLNSMISSTDSKKAAAKAD